VVTGIPSPSVTWYSTRGVILRNNTLTIANVSTNDEGEYICEAKNKAGLKTVKVRVIVAGTVLLYSKKFGACGSTGKNNAYTL
jgi:hypothetical protein